jgi:2,5-dioxopentanoate dehydrogenase
MNGLSLLGATLAPPSGTTFRAAEAATGAALAPDFHAATDADVDRACTLAAGAFETFRDSTGATRGALLRGIAAGLEADADALVARAMAETALPEARLRGELARTTNQLRLFAAVAEDGAWVDARIEPAEAQRTPPKPDLRSMLRPLGPVAVFGASNFPLAFSVAGGDTASALAAGCPVVVKAHPAHPGTSEIAGRAVQRAVTDAGLPEGVFSLLFDAGIAVGQALVRHPAIAAVGFTGSRRGGLALVEAAAQRPVPIPVYAEMGSVNPVFVLPGALADRGAEIAAALAASVTLGVGQFCTNPGLVFVTPGADDFLNGLADALARAAPGVMLTAAICGAYGEGVARLAATPGVTRLVGEVHDSGQGTPALFVTDADTFRAHPELADEVFGPATLVVRCADAAEMQMLAHGLEGQLTATLHADPSDHAEAAALARVLEGRAGRLLFGGVPTGVEVGHAVVHGGPFPATSDGRSTSVGTRAILRWARPVCWQDAPEALLPEALRHGHR